jgi:hypothetical protein
MFEGGLVGGEVAGLVVADRPRAPFASGRLT